MGLFRLHTYSRNQTLRLQVIANNMTKSLYSVEELRRAAYMFKIIRKQTFADEMFRLDVHMPAIAQSARSGNYVDIHLNPDAQPITVPIADIDADAGTITIVEQARDLPSEQLMMLQEGDEVFQIRGPLGGACDIGEKNKVVLVGEDLGVASLLLRARAYRNSGAYTICVLGFANRENMFLETEFSGVSDELYVTTEDGSYGVSGRATGTLQAICDTHKDVERIITIGRLKNMKRAAKIAADRNIDIRISFDAIRPATGAASIFDNSDAPQGAFAFARAPELKAADVEFDKLIARQKAIENEAAA